MFVPVPIVQHAVIVLLFRIEGKLTDTSPLLVRPLLQLATICEKHLTDADGSLSLIRIIDRFTISGQGPDFPVGIFLEFTLAVAFKSGPYRGRLPLTLQPYDPDMHKLPEMRMDVLFEGDDERGVNMIGKVKFQVAQEGLYWISVQLLDQEYTRIPFRVVYQPQATVQSGS